MKNIDIGQASQVIASIGVMLGLIFLAIEINQNQAALREQTTVNLLSARDAAVESFNGFRTLLLENPELIEIWNRGRTDGQELTSQEGEVFDLLCSNYIWSQVTLYSRFLALNLAHEVEATVTVLRGQRDASERFGRCWEAATGMIALRGYEDLVQRVDSGAAE